MAPEAAVGASAARIARWTPSMPKRPPPSTVRSVIPSVTSTRRSPLSSVTMLVSNVAGSVPAPRAGWIGPSSSAKPPLRSATYAGGWPQLSHASVAVGACQRASTAVTKKFGLSSARMTPSIVAAACTRSCPVRRAARSAPRAEALRPAAVGPVPAASAIASHAPSRFSTKSNQSPPTS